MKMQPSSFRHLAVAAAVLMAAVSQASAGSACCNCAVTCVTPGQYIPVLEVPNVAIVSPYYVVNHGPVYSGPGIVTYPAYAPVVRPWETYPYDATYYNYIGVNRGWYGVGHRYVRPVRVYR
jgi:hypothetical protein